MNRLLSLIGLTLLSWSLLSWPGLGVAILAAEEIAAVDPSRFEITVLATGLTQPMELAMAPDGTVYFIELSGKLKSLNPVTRAVTLVGEVTVTTAQENGLIGLAQFCRESLDLLSIFPTRLSGSAYLAIYPGRRPARSCLGKSLNEI